MITIGGSKLKEICTSGANALDNSKEEINSLNVFPVPDGDTGINMSLSLSGIAGVADNDSVGVCADEISGSVLRSARGNSGAIVALFFRGLAKALKGLDEATSADLVKAFRRGTDEAYKAVMKPTEGTILTVMRSCAEAAEANAPEDIVTFFESMRDVASETLAKTPEMLPVLKQANVVDAGGAGFVTMLNGICSALNGDPVEKTASDDAPTTNSSADFSEFNTEDIKFGYCTECIVDKSPEFVGEGTASELYEYIITFGDSAVFIDDENMIKLHIHTNNPGLVLEKAITYGSLATVKIENMRNQHTSLAVGAEEEPIKPFGFVSVCIGDGIESVFNDLGCDTIVKGGQTMNPSTQDIVSAVNSTRAETVFVLPNNKNIDMVAKQAAEIVKDKRVIVLSTRSVPQGISAMMAFDAECTAEENVEFMETAFTAVRTLSVTYAVRDAVINNVNITKGQALGLVDGKIRMVSDSSHECIKRLADYMKNAAYITIYYGENIAEKKAEKLQKMIERIAPNAEVMLINGGQPLYDYIISVE